MKDFAIGALVGGVIGVVVGGVLVVVTTQQRQQSSHNFTVLRGPRISIRGPKLIHESSKGNSTSILESKTDAMCEPKQDDLAEA